MVDGYRDRAAKAGRHCCLISSAGDWRPAQRESMAVGDGALGFWKALRAGLRRDQGVSVAGSTRPPNRANQIALPARPKPRAIICTTLDGRDYGPVADAAADFFISAHWPTAQNEGFFTRPSERLVRSPALSQSVLLSFYDFPAERLEAPIRTSRPIESIPPRCA